MIRSTAPKSTDRRGALATLAGLGGLILAGRSSPSGARAEESPWSTYKRRFLTVEGRVVDTGNGGITHTEGQGYGMVLAVAWNDRTAFDTIWNWTRATLRRPEDGLLSWRYEPGAGITDANNASDGDLLIAWALDRAARRWGTTEHARESAALRATMAERLVTPWRDQRVLLPAAFGFTHDDHIVVNPSYWIFPALRDFAQGGAGPWRDLMDSGLFLLERAVFGARNLPPDWLALPRGEAPPAPAQGFPPEFGFNAVRIPLYLRWAGISPSTVRAAASIRDFWMASPTPAATVNLETGAEAPYGISRGVEAIRALTRDGDRAPQVDPGDTDYYSATLGLLSLLAWREGSP